MKSQELQMDVLKRQNREMASKMQFYRVENQELKAKNQQLNQWVGNLSQVFATISASWQSITILQETLLNLMKKKADTKDKTMLRKYQFHFKTFADIINNLSDKIKNPGHSDQATQDAKQQLYSFVKNYQLIYKQFLETYFKFNQQYTQFLVDLKSRQDVKEQVSKVMAKAFESTQKNKEFEAYLQALKEKFKIFQDFNNQKLLQGIVKKKEQEILALKERNSIIQRRIKCMFDYNSQSVEIQLQDKQFQCVCGGVQLKYMKKAWQQKMVSSGQVLAKKQSQQQNGQQSETFEQLEVKIAEIEQEKQNLITRNSLLVQKMSKMNTQYKLTQQMILRSSAYLMLKQQCQYLLDYISELLGKLRKQKDYLNLIQKARDQQLRDVKRKYEKNRSFEQKQNGAYNNSFQHPSQLFKTQIIQYTKQLIQGIQESNKKHQKSQDSLKQFKQIFQNLRKSNQDMNKKINDLQARQLAKTDTLEFKYEKFNILQSTVQSCLQKDNPNMIQLWNQFITHVKSRDKRINGLESSLRKRQKQLAQKTQIQQLMRGSLNQTEKIYLDNKQVLKQTQTYIKKTQSQLIRLSSQYYKMQGDHEQQKSLLNLRLQTETQGRSKLEQKMSIISKINSQFSEVQDNQMRIQKDYELWLQKFKKQLEETKRDALQKQVTIKNIIQQSAQKQRQLLKLQNEKEGCKSQIRQLKNKIQTINASKQNELLKMQLQQYKGKIMCSCTGDREREVVLKTCPHLFCKRCIEDTTNNRNRKCPLCGIKFTKTDVHQIKWN